jgi:hypothetical protein
MVAEHRPPLKQSNGDPVALEFLDGRGEVAWRETGVLFPYDRAE